MSAAMANLTIQEGFEVYAHDGNVAFGAVRRVSPRELTIYIENAGDFAVPVSAVKAVHEDKVILDCSGLDEKLVKAIGRAHAAEDPNIADK